MSLRAHVAAALAGAFAVLVIGCGEDDSCLTSTDCSEGRRCVDGTCVCAPTTCAAEGAECGSIPDGCGGTLDCGSCVYRGRNGLSSGGLVERSSSMYQVELTVGPVAPAAERSSPSRSVELGVQAQTDPSRVTPMP